MGLPSITPSRQHIPIRPKRCPCPGPLVALCLFAATPGEPSARNVREASSSRGCPLPAASRGSPTPPTTGNTTTGKSSFRFLFSGQDRASGEPSPGLAIPGVVPAETSSTLRSLRGVVRGETPTPQTDCCSQSCLPSATKPKTWVRAAGPGWEGCGVLCRWRRQGHPRDPAEPSADGAAGSQHAGATALARTWGKQDLGDPSVLPQHLPAWERSSRTGHLG